MFIGLIERLPAGRAMTSWRDWDHSVPKQEPQTMEDRRSALPESIRVKSGQRKRIITRFAGLIAKDQRPGRTSKTLDLAICMGRLWCLSQPG